jgi:hypothetical protein
LITRNCCDRPMARAPRACAPPRAGWNAARGPPAPAACAAGRPAPPPRPILHALLFQTGQRTQARRIALAGSRKPLHAPGSCSSRMVWPVGAVSNTMWSYAAVSVALDQQRRELVEGGNLGGAGARQLLLDALHHVIGQHPSHRADDAVAVDLGGGLRIDLEPGEPGHGGDGGDVVADASCRRPARRSTRGRCSPAARACRLRSWIADAQAIEVLPTPPLPVKKRKRGGSFSQFSVPPPEHEGAAAMLNTLAGSGRPAQRASSLRVG